MAEYMFPNVAYRATVYRTGPTDTNDIMVLVVSFSNSGINKVAMVKNALLPMSL
jgi:hypothetical protein